MKQGKLFTVSKNTIIRQSQLDTVSDVLDYILDSELEDFADNPSLEHVYFKAYAACFGMRRANEMLTESIRDLELTKQNVSL